MKLSIRHGTVYRYRRAVLLTPHLLMITPRSSHDLTLLSSALRCEPDAKISWSQDVAGNMLATATFAQATDTLTIVGEAVVEQSASAWPVLLIDPAAHTYPFSYRPDDLADLGNLATPDPALPDRVRRWADGFVLRPTTDTLSLLKDLNAGILASVAYRVRDEEGTQTPAETLDLASGSCRDIAALFIAAARHLGFGARAVSGYLFDPEMSSEDAGSTHAWAEVFLPGAGWIGFDPTHQRMGSANLVPVAVGLSNRRIMPVSGGFVGDAEDALSMAVTIQVVAV